MRQPNTAVVEDFLRQISAEGPYAAAMVCCAPGFTWHTPGGPMVQDTLEAMSAIMWSEFDESGLKIDILGVTAQDERVAVEAVSNGRLRDGQVYNNHYHFMFELRDGKIAAIREYNDTHHTRTIWDPVFARLAG